MTLGRKDTERLLQLAHDVVTWTTQATINYDAAGAKHLGAARLRYLKARIDAYVAAGKPLQTSDCGGCTCDAKSLHDGKPDYENCLYHYAASAQPLNHRIPWNCPTFHDGCNCEATPGPEVQSAISEPSG